MVQTHPIFKDFFIAIKVTMEKNNIIIRIQMLQEISVSTTDIEKRSQNSYTAPCNGDVSHGPPIGGIRGFFTDYA